MDAAPVLGGTGNPTLRIMLSKLESMAMLSVVSCRLYLDSEGGVGMVLIVDSILLFAYPCSCRACPPLLYCISLTRSRLILADASLVGVCPNKPSSADERGGRAGDINTGGDIPGGRPSNESSSSDSLAGVVGFRREGLVRVKRGGVRTDGSRRSTTPFQFAGSVSGGR